MAELLSEAQLGKYETHGITFPIRVFSTDEAQRYRAACDSLENQLGGAPRTVDVRQMHLHFRWAFELAVHPRVLDAVEGILGCNLLVWATELFAKHSQDKVMSIGWHRDRTYMGFDAAETTTAWLALSNSVSANGCMQVVLESDRRNPIQTPGTRKLPEGQITDVELQAGEMSLHDADIFHGSGPNPSPEKRVGFAIRYVTPKARPLSGRPRVILARGQYGGDQFEIAQPPKDVEDVGAEHALSGMRESAASHFEAMLHNIKLGS